MARGAKFDPLLLIALESKTNWSEDNGRTCSSRAKSRECRYVRTLGALPVNSLIWDGGSIHDERRTRHSAQT